MGCVGWLVVVLVVVVLARIVSVSLEGSTASSGIGVCGMAVRPLSLHLAGCWQQLHLELLVAPASPAAAGSSPPLGHLPQHGSSRAKQEVRRCNGNRERT